MDIELAEKAWSLIEELHELESYRHGIYKAMLPKDVIEQKVTEYDKRIAEIQQEIEEL